MRDINLHRNDAFSREINLKKWQDAPHKVVWENVLCSILDKVVDFEDDV